MSDAAEPTAADFAALGLPATLVEALAGQGIDRPVDVQRAAIPPALAGRDLLVGAETGSGKTLAYLLPALMQLSGRGGQRALVLVPTRELVRQVAAVAAPLAAAVEVEVREILGGEDFKVQRRRLRGEAPALWVATPGRLAELCEAEPGLLEAVAVLVLDEADRMLDLGFGDTVLALAETCPAGRQSWLFSATLSGAPMRRVRERVLADPHRVRLNDPRQAQSSIRHQLLLADDDAHKVALLAAWAGRDESPVLAFCRSRLRAQQFSDRLRLAGVRSAALHGELDNKGRARAVRLLGEAKVQVLVATDVAARGLDVDALDRVANIDMPRRAHQYIHRVGRCGRAGREGEAVSLVDHSEWNLMIGIERYLGARFQRLQIEGLIGRYRGPRDAKRSGKSKGKKKVSRNRRT